LERDAQERYRRARGEVSSVEEDIAALTRLRDELREEIIAMPGERKQDSGTLGTGGLVGGPENAEEAIESVRRAPTHRSDSAQGVRGDAPSERDLIAASSDVE